MQARLATLAPKLYRFTTTRRTTVTKTMSTSVPGTFESQLKDGWFSELSSLWPGQGMSLKIDEVIFTGRSDFQV